MLTIKRYELSTKEIQVIKTKKDSKILDVFLEESKGYPYVYILENINSEEDEKSIILCQEDFDIEFENTGSLKQIGSYIVENNLKTKHIYIAFEILNPKEEIKEIELKKKRGRKRKKIEDSLEIKGFDLFNMLLNDDSSKIMAYRN